MLTSALAMSVPHAQRCWCWKLARFACSERAKGYWTCPTVARVTWGKHFTDKLCVITLINKIKYKLEQLELSYVMITDLTRQAQARDIWFMFVLNSSQKRLFKHRNKLPPQQQKSCQKRNFMLFVRKTLAQISPCQTDAYLDYIDVDVSAKGEPFN